MRRSAADPSALSGAELDQWYRRTPDKIEAERQKAFARDFIEFFGGGRGEQSAEDFGPIESDQNTGWQEARLRAPPALPAVAPSGPRVGPSANFPMPQGAGPAGGFFDTYPATPNPAFGPAYTTTLPSPLNLVTPRHGGWFELSDGSLVKGAEEVERLYAEQQRRLQGKEEAEPAQNVLTADRYRDGFIPGADQLAKNQREEDETCHPYGGWERDSGFPKYPERTRRYEAQITRAPGLDYVVRAPGERPVKFDGCAVWDPKHQLLEAKGPGYAGLIEQALRYKFDGSIREGKEDQASRQAGAARGRPVEWHIAERRAVPFFEEVLLPYPSMRPQLTPAR